MQGLAALCVDTLKPKLTIMITRLILYKLYPGNPCAYTQMVRKANRLLAHIPFVLDLVLGTPCGDPSRSVVDNDYDLSVELAFTDVRSIKSYAKHELHLQWVKFVLRGYMLKGSYSKDREAEFIDAIMTGNVPKDQILRNPLVPDSEVVWSGERVFQYRS